jgi:uncharacterized protein YaaN involved in tellurite resistance
MAINLELNDKEAEFLSSMLEEMGEMRDDEESEYFITQIGFKLRKAQKANQG